MKYITRNQDLVPGKKYMVLELDKNCAWNTERNYWFVLFTPLKAYKWGQDDWKILVPECEYNRKDFSSEDVGGVGYVIAGKFLALEIE